MSFRVKPILPSALLALGLSLLLSACGGGGGDSSPPPPGNLTTSVSTGSPATAVSGVSVMVFNANTNAPVASGTTDSTGKYTASGLVAGNYYVKLSKQGYNSVPASTALTPVPQAVLSGQTTTYAVTMSTSALTGTGWVSGKVGSGLSNVLVAVEATGVAYTAVSDAAGNYAIYNVPAAGYTVKAYAKGYSFTPVAITVSACTATPCTATTANLTATANAAGTVLTTFKTISMIPSPPATMLVSLVHPITRETIPGLSLTQTYTSAQTPYNFNGVADGYYLVRSTFANDTIVVDPDSIVKFGEPNVTVTNGVGITTLPNGSTSTTVDITATGAVQLVSPTNAMTSTTPLVVTGTTTPTFNWSAYSSTTDYVIEVMDADTGSIIWGGFTGMGTPTPSKNITIPSSQTSIVYNSDGLASAPLVAGKTYRWRVYASKQDNTTTPNWRLISMSEDQMGLFKLQ